LFVCGRVQLHRLQAGEGAGGRNPSRAVLGPSTKRLISLPDHRLMEEGPWGIGGVVGVAEGGKVTPLVDETVVMPADSECGVRMMLGVWFCSPARTSVDQKTFSSQCCKY